MSEPLLGLLTRGYATSEAQRGAECGLRSTRREVAREVMGLCSNPCQSITSVEQSW